MRAPREYSEQPHTQNSVKGVVCESSKLGALSVRRVSCSAGFIYHHADEWSRAIARFGWLEPQALTVALDEVLGRAVQWI